jgi:hypothetical protein
VTDLAKLVVKLEAQTAQYMSALDAANRKLDRFQRDQNMMLNKVTGGFKKAFGALAAGMSLRAIVQATAEAEKSMALLENAVRATGGSAGYTSKQLADMAADLQRTTTFSDDAIMGMQQLLLRFQSIQGVRFDRAQRSVLDLATVLNMDLAGAAKLVGKALENPAKGMSQLARAGVSFSEDQKKVIQRLIETGEKAKAQEVMLAGLESKFNGAAVAARETFGGALAGLKNAAGDLLEVKTGLPGLIDQINHLTEVLENPRLQQGVDRLGSGLLRVVGVGAEGLAELGNLGEILGRWQADAFGNLSEYDELTAKIEDVDTAIRNIDSSVSKFFSTPVPLLGKSLEQLQELRKEAERERDLLIQAWGITADKAAEATAAVPEAMKTGPSEAFLDLEEKLNEQIALFGKTGQAAKLAYDIQIGAIEDLTTAEGERLLVLARQLDSMQKAADAAKVEEQNTQKLADAYKSHERDLIKQIYLNTEASKVEQLRYEMNNEGLQGLSEANRKYLLILGAEVDELNERRKLEEQVKAVTESLLTPTERYAARIEELNNLFLRTGAILGGQGMSFETYRRAVEQAQIDLENATKKSNKLMEDAARDTQGILADTLFAGMEGEITRIDKLFLAMINRLVAQALAAQLTAKLFGGEGMGSGGGLVGKAIDFVGGMFRDTGGSGQKSRPYMIGTGAQPEMFVPDSAGEFYPANEWMGMGSRSVNQTIVFQGKPDRYTPRQIALETSRQQRVAARLGG